MDHFSKGSVPKESNSDGILIRYHCKYQLDQLGFAIQVYNVPVIAPGLVTVLNEAFCQLSIAHALKIHLFPAIAIMFKQRAAFAISVKKRYLAALRRWLMCNNSDLAKTDTWLGHLDYLPAVEFYC